MVNNSDAKHLTSSLLKVKVKAGKEQSVLKQRPLLPGLIQVPPGLVQLK